MEFNGFDRQSETLDPTSQVCFPLSYFRKISIIRNSMELGILNIVFDSVVQTARNHGVHYQLVASISFLLIIPFLANKTVLSKLQFLQDWFRFVAHNRIYAFCALFVFSFILYAAFSVCFKYPEPAIQDEFGYLLTADTFSHGHLTNLPHLFWKHFEFEYILQQPTYNSKYPVGQAVFLAIGQILTGYPIVGVWFSGALACLACFWALRAWLLSETWAFYGGVLTAVHPLIFTWSQNYWGGFVAMLGGALCFGGILRIIRTQHIFDAVVVAIGLAILSNSRQFEGLLFSLPLVLFLLVWSIKKFADFASPMKTFSKVYVPILFVMLLNFTWLAAYNYHVTGDALKLPYIAYNEQYDHSPIFIFQSLDTPKVDNQKSLENGDADISTNHIRKSDHLTNPFIRGFMWLLDFLVWFTVSPLLFVVFVCGLIVSVRSRHCTLALLLLLFFVLGVQISSYFFPQYLAPAFCLIILFSTHGARYLWQLDKYQLFNRTAIILLPIALFTGIMLFGVIHAKRTVQQDAGHQRAMTESYLKSLPGKHLILVDNPSKLTNTNLFVYNKANIDDSSVIWARQISQDEDRKLLDYFSDRRVWLLSLTPEGTPQLKEIGTGNESNK